MFQENETCGGSAKLWGFAPFMAKIVNQPVTITQNRSTIIVIFNGNFKYKLRHRRLDYLTLDRVITVNMVLFGMMFCPKKATSYYFFLAV